MKNYTFRDYNNEHMARAVGMALPISFKQSTEICRFIKSRKVSDAKKILQGVIEKKIAIPFRVYNWDLGHKKKIGPGRYPQKASQHFIKIIEAAEANAQFKGLNTSNLVLAHISAHNAGKTWHYGRKQRRKMKRTHLEIVVEEKSVANQDKKVESKRTKPEKSDNK